MVLENVRKPEFQFMLDVLGRHIFRYGTLPDLPPEVSWANLFDLLNRHRLAGLFHMIAQKEEAVWPADFLNALKKVRIVAGLTSDLYRRYVNRLLADLKDKGIPTIVFKGWALIENVYQGDFSLRLYDDIDLLVPPEYALRSEIVLSSLGLYPLISEPWNGYNLRYRNARTYVSWFNLEPFNRVLSIGLHWGLLDTPFYNMQIATQSLFERAVPATIAGVSVQTLAPVDFLVYACGHMAIHHSYDESLFRYYEIAVLIRNTGVDMDWEALIQRARDWRLAIPVRTVIENLSSYWPGLVPDVVIQELQAVPTSPAERIVHDLIVHQRINHTLRSTLDWLAMPGAVRRIRFLVETTFPSPDYVRRRYGPAPLGIWPLLYFKRITTGAQLLIHKSNPVES